MQSLNWEMMRIIVFAFFSFLAAFVITPGFVRLLKKYKMGKSIRDAESAPVMNQLHAAKAGTPTMGGVVIWVSVLLVIGATWIITQFGAGQSWNILSRSQTLLPLGAMIAAALVGLLDDYLNVRRIGAEGRGSAHALSAFSLYGSGRGLRLVVLRQAGLERRARAVPWEL